MALLITLLIPVCIRGWNQLHSQACKITKLTVNGMKIVNTERKRITRQEQPLVHIYNLHMEYQLDKYESASIHPISSAWTCGLTISQCEARYPFCFVWLTCSMQLHTRHLQLFFYIFCSYALYGLVLFTWVDTTL